jgi:hypothetical protein
MPHIFNYKDKAEEEWFKRNGNLEKCQECFAIVENRGGNLINIKQTYDSELYICRCCYGAGLGKNWEKDKYKNEYYSDERLIENIADKKLHCMHRSENKELKNEIEELKKDKNDEHKEPQEAHCMQCKEIAALKKEIDELKNIKKGTSKIKGDVDYKNHCEHCAQCDENIALRKEYKLLKNLKNSLKNKI